MTSYNTLLRYFFPFFIFLQYVGCDSYQKLANSRPRVETAIAVQTDCIELEKHVYNGFYAPSENGKLFKKKGEFTLDSLRVGDQPIIGINEIQSVSKTYDVTGMPSIQATFTEKGKQLFKEHTANNIGKKVAIVIKDKLVTAPIIHAEIPGGKIEVSGQFTQEEVDLMYAYLKRAINCVKSSE